MNANTTANNNTPTDTAEATAAEKASFSDKAHATLDKSKEAISGAATKSADAISGAAKSTTEAVKSHPGTTAAIVAGAAAAIAGAAFGASKLIEKNKAATDTKTDGTKKSDGAKTTK